jgi:hypothetical protein
MRGLESYLGKYFTQDCLPLEAIGCHFAEALANAYSLGKHVARWRPCCAMTAIISAAAFSTCREFRGGLSFPQIISRTRASICHLNLFIF